MSQDLRSTFHDPESYLKFRKGLENPSFSSFESVVKDGEKSKLARVKSTKKMKRRLGDRTDLLVKVEPDFSPSCRRLTPGPGYLEALAQPNVEYVTTAIAGLTKAGNRTTDGQVRNVDAVICCTRSEKSFALPFPVVNRGVNLASAWKAGGSIGYPITYLGIAALGFPNLFFVNGPNAASATGTLPFATENQLTFIARILRKVQRQGIRTVTSSIQTTENFRAYHDAYS